MRVWSLGFAVYQQHSPAFRGPEIRSRRWSNFYVKSSLGFIVKRLPAELATEFTSLKTPTRRILVVPVAGGRFGLLVGKLLSLHSAAATALSRDAGNRDQ